jgi:hypothetical protein
MEMSDWAKVSRVTLLLVVGLSAATSADHSWGPYHWARTGNPFTLKVGDNVNPTWDTYLDEAIADWTPSEVLDLTKVAGGTRPKSCRPTSGRIEVCNDRYGNTGWLGIAQIWIGGGDHITQGIAKMNDYYFNSAPYNTPAWRRLVMCQEIAHDFGLDHQDETFDNPNLGSCMDYTNDPDGGAGGAASNDPSNEHANQHDFDQLVSIYSHLDSTTTVGSALPQGTPSAMNQIEFESHRQWGRLVRMSRNGRVHIYELDFGNGNKVVTHVFWADPEEDARHDH